MRPANTPAGSVAPARPGGRRGGQGWVVAVLVLAVVLAWRTPVVFPLKVFTALLHELGHAAAAVLTGGSVERLELTADLGGACWARGGWRPLVLPAGYLGSMVFGGLILLAAARVRRDEVLAAALGLILIALTAVFVRGVFGVVFGAVFGIALLAAARWLPRAANGILLKLIGLTSVLYAGIDIWQDLIGRTVPGSDAWAMAQEFFLPPVFWGVLWLGLALGAAGVLLRAAVRSEAAGQPPLA